MQTSGSCSCCCSSALSAPWLSLLHEPPTQQNNCTFRWLRSSSTTGKKLESLPVKWEKTVGYRCWYLVPIRAMKNSPLPSLPAGPPGAAGSPSAHTAPGTAGRAAPWLRPGHAHIWPHTGTPALPGSVTAVGETIRNTHIRSVFAQEVKAWGWTPTQSAAQGLPPAPAHTSHFSSSHKPQAGQKVWLRFQTSWHISKQPFTPQNSHILLSTTSSIWCLSFPQFDTNP